MPRKLKNVDVSFVSIVDKAANKKKFFLTKSEQEPTFEKEVRIIKGEDEEQKLVYGIVYSPGSAGDPRTHDAHGDFMTAEEIEKSAHNFIAKYRNIDTQHDFNAGAGEVVESYVAPVDMDINGETITKGTW
ncbi:XkdF-like putative serine protease domain-containing protein, partial [Bacillus toyonensis]